MSIEGLLSLLAVLALLLAATAYYAWQLRKTLRSLTDALHRAEAAGQEQATRIAALEQLRDSQQLAEHAVATGTALVREVHKGIAEIPFSVLEAIPGARQPAKAVRGLHDAISEGIYGAISGLNKAVGRELRKGLQAPAADRPASSVPEPSKSEAAKPAPEPEPPAAPEPDTDPETKPLPDKPWKNWG